MSILTMNEEEIRNKNNKEYKLSLLNEINKLITKEDIEKILYDTHISYIIDKNKISYFIEALTHNSYVDKVDYMEDKAIKKFFENNQKQLDKIDLTKIDINDVIPLQKKSYDRLEFKGDSILHSIISIYLIERYETFDEGTLSKLRSKIESCETFSSVSQNIGLYNFLLISKYMENNRARYNKHILEDVFESFIGALQKATNDLNLIQTFVINIIEKHLDLSELINNEINYKAILLEHISKNKILNIKIEEEEKNNDKIFKSNILLNNKIISFDTDLKRIDATQKACKKALIYLKIINESDEEEILIPENDVNYYKIKNLFK